MMQVFLFHLVNLFYLFISNLLIISFLKHIRFNQKFGLLIKYFTYLYIQY